MARRLPESLRELSRYGGSLFVRCKKCGREARFSVRQMADWFRANGIRDDWASLGRRFRCDGHHGGCGARDVEVRYSLDAPAPAAKPAAPLPVDPPAGVDPDLWAKASDAQRRALVREAGSFAKSYRHSGDNS